MVEGFKNTEIGVIPDDWRVQAIDQEIDLLTGFPFPSSGYCENGIKLLRCSNVKRGVTDWTEGIVQYWSKITPELKFYVLNDGDIVIAMDGSLVGKSFARLSKNDLPALLLQRVARIRSNKIDLGYLKEFICSNYFTKYCDNVKTSSAIPHISPKDIRGFIIPIPPTKAEQTAIATALNDANALISHLEKLIAKKRAIKQGVMQELLRPKEGWEVKKLGKIFKFLRTANSSRADLQGDGEIGYIHYGDIHTKWRGFLDCAQNALPSIPYSKIKGVPFIQEGDLIIADASEDYEGLGICIEVRNVGNRKIISGLHTLLLRGDKDVIVDGFKGYFRDYFGIRNALIASATGVSVYGISKSRLSSFDIFIPSCETQTRIASILSDMDAEIEALEKKIEKYKMIKQGMMQVLLTGKVRLV